MYCAEAGRPNSLACADRVEEAVCGLDGGGGVTAPGRGPAEAARFKGVARPPWDPWDPWDGSSREEPTTWLILPFISISFCLTASGKEVLFGLLGLVGRVACISPPLPPALASQLAEYRGTPSQ
mmetsp:Transcript_128197/g.304385  ORF Transcript_128197/g.304385 Transcript_128197/m.304385 type:complete len:124 (+) Transcript_128197:35-406(+)